MAYSFEDFKNDLSVFGENEKKNILKNINDYLELSKLYKLSFSWNDLSIPVMQMMKNRNVQGRYTSIISFLNTKKSYLSNFIELKKIVANSVKLVLNGYLLDMKNSYSKFDKFVRPDDASMINIAVEKGIKSLYTIANIDDFVNSIISDSAKRGRIIDSLGNVDRYQLDLEIASFWKGIKDGFPEDSLRVLENFLSSSEKQKLPKKWSGHSIFPILEKLPSNVSTMIKYYITTGFAKDFKDIADLNTDNAFTALDYFLMIRDYNIEEAALENYAGVIYHSNDFDNQRYTEMLNELDFNFNKNFVYALYLVFQHEFSGLNIEKFNTPHKYNCINGLYSQELDDLIKNDDSKLDLLNNLIKDPLKVEKFNTMNSRDFYVLISKFNENEIDWMFETVKNSNECTIEEMLYYCIFFKQYVDDFSYDENKYKHINSLFYSIKNSNDLSKLGSQINSWFTTIDLSKLSKEEFDVLDKIDAKYLYNSLSFRDRILYNKCKEKGYKFRLYYTQRSDCGDFDILLSSGATKNYTESEIPVSLFNSLKRSGLYNFFKQSKLTKNLNNAQNILLYFASNEIDVTKVPMHYFNYSFYTFLKVIERVKLENISIYEIPQSYFQEEETISKRARIVKWKKLLSDDCELNVTFSNIGRPVFNYSINDISKKYDCHYDAIKYLFEKDIAYEDIKELLDKISVLKFPMNNLDFYVEYLPCENIYNMIEKRIEFLVSNGIDYENVSSGYYTSSEEKLMELFTILNGELDLNHIPVSFFTTDCNVIEFIQKLKSEGINITKFVKDLLGNVPFEIIKDIDNFLNFYRRVYDVKLDANMVDQGMFDLYNNYKLVVSFSKNKKFSNSIFYSKNSNSVLIYDYCTDNNLSFYSELLYFGYNFVSNYYYDIIEGIRDFYYENEGIRFSYENAKELENKINTKSRGVKR